MDKFRDLKFNKKKIYEGVDKIAKAVGSTLGPKGRPVLIEDQPGHGRPTKDGVTVARHTILSDSEENLGASFVTQAASATVQVAGDGTTTSTVLAQAIIQDATESVDFIKGIEQASKDVVEYLNTATEEMTEELIEHIAHISTNSDKDLSKTITEAFVETGEDGIVDVQYSPTIQKTKLVIKQGSYLPAGYSHQHFITNMRQRTAEFENPLVLVSNSTFNELTQIDQIFKLPLRTQRPVILIGDFEKNFTESFTSNIQAKKIRGCLIETGPHAGSDALRDLAALLGAIYFDNANGNNFDYLTEDHWGEADSAVIGQTFSLFALGSNDHVQDRIDDLKSMIDETDNEGLKGEYKARLSMLNGKYATITVGAPTQGEALEIKDRLEDAVSAVGAAQKFGYLPGGGIALLEASNSIDNKGDVTDYDKGYNHLLKAIRSPFHKILSNAGIDCDCNFDFGFGVDASTGETVNMVEAGIIDPALVTKQALVNAVSVATTLLLCEATLIIAKE